MYNTSTNTQQTKDAVLTIARKLLDPVVFMVGGLTQMLTRLEKVIAGRATVRERRGYEQHALPVYFARYLEALACYHLIMEQLHSGVLTEITAAELDRKLHELTNRGDWGNVYNRLPAPPVLPGLRRRPRGSATRRATTAATAATARSGTARRSSGRRWTTAAPRRARRRRLGLSRQWAGGRRAAATSPAVIRGTWTAGAATSARGSRASAPALAAAHHHHRHRPIQLGPNAPSERPP